MNLTFLSPLFLLGLVAGVLPILIHRLIQRKAIPRSFSAVRLLIQSQRIMARPERLKHLLLLALRVMAVLGLVFMMARPVLTGPGLLTQGIEEAKVILLDNSMSMNFRDRGMERLDLAKKAAREVIEDLKGTVMIIPTAPSLSQSSSGRELEWKQPQEAIRELAKIPLSFGRGDQAASLKLAFGQLRDLKRRGEILVISDMTKGDWDGFDPSQLGLVADGVPVSFLRIGPLSRDPNVAVKGVRLTEGEAVAGVPVRLEVTVSNLSNEPKSTLVQLFLSQNKVDQRSIELKADEEGKVTFQFSHDKPGWINGEVRLSGDLLPLDDLYYFPLKVRDKTRVLIVDGDPKMSIKASESYYLARSLNPETLEKSAFVTRVITEEELPAVDLKLYDVLFLLNVAQPDAFRVASALESAKTVFIFLGDRVIPEAYNRLSLFPWRIGAIEQAEPLKPARITRVDESREALKPFSHTGGGSLKTASFHRYYKIEGSRRDLLALGNGTPLLTESSLGNGKLFLFASSADLDWNDLPLKAAYLPLIQGLVKEASGHSANAIPPGIRFGEPFGEKIKPAQVTGAQNGPGIYRSLLPSGEERWGVNLHPEESDLNKMSPGEMKKKLGTIETKVVEYQEGTLGTLKPGRKELWPWLLAFVLIVLVVEMGIANGFPRTAP